MWRAALVSAVAFLTACGESGPNDPPDPAPAGLELSTFTQGAPSDPDGYLLQLDGDDGTSVAVNDTLTLPEVAVGNHRVELSGLAANCAVAGPNPRTVVAVAGLVLRVRLDVRCSPIAGVLRVEVSTRGIRPDADGYLVTATGAERPVESNGTLTIPDVPPGDIVVSLGGISPNCRTLGDNPVTASVSAGDTAFAGFAIECAAAAEGRLLVTSDRGGTFHLYGVREDGSDLRNLTPSLEAFGGDWSPDGSRIVFSARNGDGSELFVMNADGSDVTSLGVAGSGPRWSPDGRAIAFTSSEGITLVDPGGTNRRVLAEGRNPDWAPDAQHIAFDRVDRSRCFLDFGCPVEIFVMAADGGGIHRITTARNPTDAMFYPRWSPDGTRIAYGRVCCFLEPNSSGLYVSGTSGTFARRVYPEVVRGSIAWSPDGSTIAAAVAGLDGKTDIFAIPRGGGTATVLFSTAGGDYPQAWR